MSTQLLVNTRPLWVKGAAQDTSEQFAKPHPRPLDSHTNLSGPGAEGQGTVTKGGQDLLPP